MPKVNHSILKFSNCLKNLSLDTDPVANKSEIAEASGLKVFLNEVSYKSPKPETTTKDLFQM